MAYLNVHRSKSSLFTVNDVTTLVFPMKLRSLTVMKMWCTLLLAPPLCLPPPLAVKNAPSQQKANWETYSSINKPAVWHRMLWHFRSLEACFCWGNCPKPVRSSRLIISWQHVGLEQKALTLKVSHRHDKQAHQSDLCKLLALIYYCKIGLRMDHNKGALQLNSNFE